MVYLVAEAKPTPPSLSFESKKIDDSFVAFFFPSKYAFFLSALCCIANHELSINPLPANSSLFEN